MRGLNYPEQTAKDEGNAELLKEVLPDGPSLVRAVLAMAKALCTRLGKEACPFGGKTCEGFCVADWSPCVRDSRQPTLDSYVKAQSPVNAPSPAAKK